MLAFCAPGRLRENPKIAAPGIATSTAVSRPGWKAAWMRTIRVLEARRAAIELPRKTLAARLAMSLRTLERSLAGERELTSMELHKFADLMGLEIRLVETRPDRGEDGR